MSFDERCAEYLGMIEPALAGYFGRKEGLPFDGLLEAMDYSLMAGGKRLIPGNLTLSNVPGPAEPRSYAGFAQRHNYPVPIIGSGRFLNITSRRSGDNLDMGVIADAEKIVDVDRIATLFIAALDELETFA